MIKIIIDCFGGDHSPEANVDGALVALAKLSDLYLILTGDEATLQNCLKGKTYDASRLENCVAAGKQPVGLLPTTQEIGFEGFVSFVTKKR